MRWPCACVQQVTAKSESAKRGAQSTQQSGQQPPSTGKLHQPLTEPFQQQRQQAAPEVQHCQYLGSHRKSLPPEAAAAVEKSTSSGQQAAAEAAFSAACLTERQLVSYPQVFSWGGRVKGKHSSLCRMQAGAQAIGAGVTSQAGRTTDAAATLSNSSSSTKPSPGSSSSGTGQRLQPHAVEPLVVPGAAQDATSKSDLCQVSGSGTAAQQAGLGMLMASMGVADADVSAAAARLGANADRLMHLLDSRKQKQQQKGAPGPKQQYSKTARATPSRQVDGLVGGVQDEPIGGGLDYLRL